DESRAEPINDGGEDDHRPIIERAFLVTSRQSTPLFESIDTALDDVATGIDRFVEDQRSLRDGVLDLPPAQQVATARITVAFVSDEVMGARPRPPSSAWSWDADAVQDRLQLGTVMALSRSDDDRERSAFAVAREVDFARQPAAAAPKSLVNGVT